ncbi:MAG: Sec-independent protein translocase subunit TatA [Gammaproteobacteria bacterium]
MGISIWQLVIVLVIVLLLFGTKKLRNLGGDLGASIKSFRKAVREGETPEEESKPEQLEKSEEVIEGETVNKEKDSA